MPKDFEKLSREKLLLESTLKILQQHYPIIAKTVMDRIEFIEKELQNGRYQNPSDTHR